MCRSRRELSNAYLLAKFCFDTAENEPSKVYPIGRRRAAELRAGGKFILAARGLLRPRYSRFDARWKLSVVSTKASFEFTARKLATAKLAPPASLVTA